MKKIISVILFLIIVAACGVSSFAAENAEISFKTSGPDANGKVVVDVVISDGGEPTMLQFCVAYDSAKLECVSVNAGNALSGNLAPVINVTDGQIYFVWDSLTPLASGGTLLQIEFRLKDGNKNASAWIDENEEFIVADDNFDFIGTIAGKAEISAAENSQASSSENSEVSSEESSVPESSESSSEQTESEFASESSGSSEQSEADNNTETEEGYSNGIVIENTRITINMGEEKVINISGTDKTVYWYSSNEKIVLVEEGKIIPVAPGTATVTVVTEDGLEEAACVVTVVGEAVSEGSSEQESENTIEVDSPRQEKESSVPAWAWIVIAVLAAGIICVAVIIVKKSGIADKK